MALLYGDHSLVIFAGYDVCLPGWWSCRGWVNPSILVDRRQETTLLRLKSNETLIVQR